MRPTDCFYLIAKLVNKYQVDYENDPMFSGLERDIIRQGMRDLVYYSPYSAKEDIRQPGMEAGAKREPERKASRK